MSCKRILGTQLVHVKCGNRVEYEEVDRYNSLDLQAKAALQKLVVTLSTLGLVGFCAPGATVQKRVLPALPALPRQSPIWPSQKAEKRIPSGPSYTFRAMESIAPSWHQQHHLRSGGKCFDRLSGRLHRPARRPTQRLVKVAKGQIY